MKPNLKIIVMITFLITIGFSGCISLVSEIRGEWTLVSYGDLVNSTPALTGVNTSIHFNADFTFNGNVGCNLFGGNWKTTRDGGISFNNIVSTEMYCEEIWEQETAVLGLFSNNHNLQIIWEDDNTMIITNDTSIVKLTRFIQGTGTIRYIDLEDGFYGILGDDQVHYDPINLPEVYKQNNLKVEFKARFASNQNSIHMWGKIIYILEIEQLLPSGNLTNQTTCKDYNTSKTPSNQDCIQYQYDGLQNLIIKHQNAGFNCCPEIATNISIKNNIITIKEIELSGSCRCLCLFDLEYQIINLPPAIYTITVQEPHIKQEESKLEFIVNLTNSQTGTYCVERFNYPWG